MSHKPTNSDQAAILSLWHGWLLASGAITAVAVLSLWITRIWLPIVTLTLGLLLYIIVRRNNENSIPRCHVVTYTGIYVMVISGLIMTAIDVINTPSVVSHPLIDSRTSIVPYMGSLIVYPVAAVLYIYVSARRFNLRHCRHCRIRNGYPSERGLLGAMFSQEGIFQRRTMAWITTCMAVAQWFYYFWDYINVSLSQADIYMFVVMPAVVFVIAAICIGVRCLSLYFYYDRDKGGVLPTLNNSTTVRFIIICDNDILLHIPDPNSETVIGDEKIDTPAKITLPYRRHVSLSDARTWILNMGGYSRSDDVEVRFMYSGNSANAESNMFHYLVFVNSRDSIHKGLEGCEWFNIYDIDKMLKQGLCNHLFGAEMKRLHTTAMAWKTYDRDGRRRYKIKNYVPTFRVCDIKKWDVDYNDPHWMFIAENNEDRPFYKLRKFWHRYISGIND